MLTLSRDTDSRLFRKPQHTDIDDLEQLCTCVDICLSLDPEDAMYFAIPNLRSELRNLVEKYRNEVSSDGTLSDIEVEYYTLVKALEELSRKYVQKFNNIPYYMRLLFCIMSRLLDPRIQGLRLVESWGSYAPDFYTIALPFIKHLCLGDKECIKEILEKFGQKCPMFTQLVYLYSNIKVARKFVEALTRFLSERFRLLAELGVDPRRYLILSKLARVVTGTAVELPTGLGTMMTLQDMLLTQYFDMVVIGLPLGRSFVIGLSYFLDFVKTLVEHTTRIMNENLMALQQTGITINPLRFRKLDEVLAYISVVVQGVKALLRVDRIETPNLSSLISALYDLRRVLFELEKEYEVNIITIIAVYGPKILEEMKEEKTRERKVETKKEITPV